MTDPLPQRVTGVIATVGDPGRVDYGSGFKDFLPIPDIEADQRTFAGLFSRALQGRQVEVVPPRVLREPSAAELIAAVREQLAVAGTGVFVLMLSGHGFSFPGDAPGQEGIAGLNYGTIEGFATRRSFVCGRDLGATLRGAHQDLTVVTIIDSCSADGIPLIRAARHIRSRLRRRSAFTFSCATKEGEPTQISIAAAGEGMIANAPDVGGVHRGALVTAVDEAWGNGMSTYEEWFVAAAGLVPAELEQVPVLRSVGSRTDTVGHEPFVPRPGALPAEESA